MWEGVGMAVMMMCKFQVNQTNTPAKLVAEGRMELNAIGGANISPGNQCNLYVAHSGHNHKKLLRSVFWEQATPIRSELPFV